MKKLTVLTLTLALIAAMAVTTANAQEAADEAADAAVADWEFNIESRVLIEDQPHIYDIAFLDDDTLISVDEEGYIRAWNVANGAERWHLRDNDESVRCLAVPSHDPSFIALGTSDGEIHMIYSDGSGVREGDWFGQPPWHTQTIRDLAFQPGTYRLASAGGDTTVRIWDVEDPNTLLHLLTLQGHTHQVYSVAWHPNLDRLASASDDDTVRLWETLNGTTTAILQHPTATQSVAWHPDGNILASGRVTSPIDIWDTTFPQHITYVDALVEHTGFLSQVAFSPDGQTLVSASTEDILFWNTHTLGDPGTFPLESITKPPSPHAGYINGESKLAFSPNGRILATRYEHLNNDDLSSGRSTIVLHETSPADYEYEVGDGEDTAPADYEYEVVDGEDTADGRSDIEILIHTLGITIADVNRDGDIDSEDLVEVAENYGLEVVDPDAAVEGDYVSANPAADINKDGKVDVTDILIMIVAIDAAEAIGAPAAPAAIKTGNLQAADVRQWLRDAKQANADPAGIAALERLLTSLNRRDLPVPKKTVLLANYPNPFNPETWIPYQLAEAAEVQVSIYSADGKLVRTLELGQRPAGAYSEKDRAAYWDGRNAQGEPVASGIYFYTLTAGEFSATRKMVIRK